jgi:hypothetical protein
MSREREIMRHICRLDDMPTTADIALRGTSVDNNTINLKKDTIFNFNIAINLNGNDIDKEEVKSFFEQLKNLITGVKNEQ